MENDLKNFYEVFLKPNLTILEEQRKNLVNKLNIILFFYGIFMTIAGLVLWKLSDTFCLDKDFKIFIFIAMIIFSWETWSLYKKLQFDYGQNFKYIVIRPIVHFIDDNLNYDPKKEILPKKFYTSHFFKGEYAKIDVWQGEDYVNGTFDKISMEFNEINAEEKIDYGDSVEYITIFRGLFFSFNINKDFKGTTLISVHKSLFGKLSSWSLGKNIKKIQLKDPKLARNLIIYSNNFKIASQFLNNDFLHSLLIFQHWIKHPIYLSFIDSKLYLAIPIKKNLFEASIFKPVNFELVKESFDYLQIGIKIMKIIKDTMMNLGNENV
ncbi:MAG: DUF3137 domain-containing protein [Proteobacteria bacterium]|nr:DUF3137 domain-containing protein [Pseudomonadota bacterium]